MKAYLAVDLGAESGRVMRGTLQDGRVSLEEIHRFPNSVLTSGKHLCWDLTRLEREIVMGIEKAGYDAVPVAGISADSWGVDYVLLDPAGHPLGDPVCYRDPRTHEASRRLLQRLPFADIYAETGIQFMTINTIFHLEAQQAEDRSVLENAAGWLNIADYFNARFSGVTAAEQSLASTTQLYNPRTQSWSEKIIDALGLKKSLLPKIVPSATVLGPVVERLRALPALRDAKVVATCSHDTGAAVAAVPATGNDWAYLSSGTWSLLGAELPQPIMTEPARDSGFTNEVGLGGTIRFLKNIAGLWVLQECRRSWAAAGQNFSYEDLNRLAADHGAAAAHIGLGDSRFLSPGDMPAKIEAFCRETSQPVPKGHGAFVRTILESLALTYAQTLCELERLTGRKFLRLHVVGGGSQSRLLNELTSAATGINVVAGPVEATAIGNVLIQALALGHLTSADELRAVVERSFPTQTFPPGHLEISEETRARFRRLKPKSS